MAKYYLDENGNVTTKKRNQRKKGKNYILGSNGGIIEVESLGGEEDIAPVRETAKKEEKEDDSKLDFFQKGLFDDGYDAGDITKTILGTAGDIGLGLVKGVAKIGEGAGKAIATGVAGVADKIGQDEYAARVRKNLKESAIDNLTEDASDYLDDRSVLGRTSKSIVEGVGQVGGILATGGMGAAAGLGTAGVTALTTGVTGVSSFGHGVGEAYKGGAKEGEAELYGLIAGAADAGTELLFGGLGKAVKAKGLSTGVLSFDDALAKKVSGLFSNQIAKNLTEYGIKSSAEGAEEVLAGVIQAVGKKVTYMSDEELADILEDENLLEQFVVGAVTSGIAQAPSLVQSTKQGRDFVTGRTENEEAVISKEVEKRIEKAKAEGKTLSKKEEAAIAEQVEQDMEKGRISTDTIEEVLGGEAYERYKKVADTEDSLSKEEEAAREEFNTLNRMKKGDMTGEQTDRLEELRTKLTDISSRREKMTQDQVKDNLKKNLSDEVSAFVKNDRLIESYNEKARRSQAFEADLEAYSPEQRKVVEKAVKSGILNNTNRTHEFVDIVAKISADKGVLFDFTNNERLKASGFAVEGATVNGYITKDGIAINMDSPKAWQSTVGHEITHVLEGTEVYTELQSALFEYAKAKNDYQGRYDTLNKLYKGKNVEAELTADLVGDYLFTDEAFVNSLSTKHRNVFQKIYDEIKYLAKIVTAGSKEARQLEKVKRAFDKAYKAQGNTQDGSIAREKTEASISKASEQQVGSANHGLTKEQQAYFKDSVVRDENGNLKVMYHGTSQGGHTMFDPYGKARYGLFGAGSYFTDSNAIAESYTKKGKGNSPQVYETYLNITNPIDMDAPAVPAEWKKAMPDVDFPQSGTNEDFYRAMEDYFEGNEYPRWEAAETAMEVIEGMGYDGITHIGGGRVNADGERHQVYIAFRPEQIKNIDNAKPTSDPDIRYSLSPVEAVEPKSDKWQRTHTTEEAKEAFPNMWNVAAEESEVRNPTQIRSTVNTYRNIYNILQSEGFNGTILDASSGLGDGTRAGIEEYGFNVEDIEPYPDSGYNPKYKDYSALNKKYDVIISNAVLNVLPQDQRDALVVKMGDLLKEGGRMFINVRGNDVESLAKTGKNIHLGTREWIETVKGSYQKGFTKDELKAYLEDALGDGYTVDKSSKFGGVAVVVTKNGGDAKPTGDPDIRYSLSEDSEGRGLNPAVQKRFENSKAVDENGNLKVLYHGTASGEFSVFDKSKGSVEGDFGSGFYFTDNESDVSNNYEGGGPDFDNKVARRAEQIEAEEDIDYDEAKERARKELYKGSHKFEVYLNIENPAIVGETMLFDNERYLSEYNEEDFDDYDEYIAEVDQLLADDIDKIVWEVDRNTGVYSTDGIAEVLYEAYAEGGIGIEELKSKINELYLEDENGNLVGNEVTRQIIESLGYDGIIDPTVSTKWNMDMEEGTTHYIVFKPNQIKSVTNQNPTDNPDIRFSLSDPVEETNELVAVHNLTEEKLLKSLKLGGLPMPSVAITRAADGHDTFGNVSLILQKNAIDPKANEANKVYSGDAWTPTYPRVEYKVDTKVTDRVQEKVDALLAGTDYASAFGYLGLDSDNVNDAINRNGGDVFDAFGRKEALKLAYLKDSGIELDLPKKQEELSGRFDNEIVVEFAERYGKEKIREINNSDSKSIFEEYVPEIKELVEGYYGKITGEKMEWQIGLSDVYDVLDGALKYFNKGIQYRTVTSSDTRKMIDEAVDDDGYRRWLDDLFSGVVEKEGIRNNTDLFTPSGKRRTWEALHWENTLENVVRAMKNNGEKGIGVFGGGNIFGASTTGFGSIKEIKGATDRLQNLSDEEFSGIKQGFSDRFFEIARKLPKSESYSALAAAQSMLVEAVVKFKTRSAMDNYLKRESQGWANYSEATVDELISLVDDIKSMPTRYFEAKPQRAVGFDEVGVFVIPRNADVKLKQELLNRGYAIAEYDPDVDGDRQKVVNSFEEYKFSLSDAGQTQKRYGNFATPASDLRLEAAPVREDIAPAQETAEEAAPVRETATTTQADEYAPIPEAEANALQEKSLASLGDADAPPETDAPYYGESEEMAPDDPFEDRDIKEVGSRKVKAYMYENPEVKPFFQDEAKVMLGELERTIKGERIYTEGDFGGYGGDSYYRWTGTKRQTSDDIAYLLDEHGYTYAEIEKGLNAIIEDDGKENNAVSKRIEFLLNDRLLKGYQDDTYGLAIPPSQDYANLLNEKQITEYNEEAQKRLFETADANAPAEDIAPARETVAPPAAKEPVYPPMVKNADGIRMDFDKGNVVETKQEPTVTRKDLHESIMIEIKSAFRKAGFDFDKVLQKAKNLSTFATVDNTPQRVMDKSLGYEAGHILSDLTVNKVAQNETEGIRWLNSFTDRKNGLLAKISKEYGIKPGSKKSAAAQMYAEGFYVDGDNNIIAYGDKELAADFPNILDQTNIKRLANDQRIRKIYDDTLEAINASRRRNAYPEIPRLDNYFLHFRAMEDTFSRLGLPFNPNDIRAKDLPTDLNGVTADLKPGQPYFASAKHRMGKRTSFDLLGGLEKYLSSAKNQIYHIDDIQTLRALRNYIADTFGQAHGLENLDSLSDEEADARIKEVFGAHLSTFAKFLNEEANVIAGKTSLVDRGIEGIIGRRGIATLDTINRQVGANMVGLNLSSSLTNFLAVVQATAKSNKFDVVKAYAQTVANRVGSLFGKGDGFADASPVMVRRKGIAQFHRTPWQKASDGGYVLMSAVDGISTELIARMKFNELTRKGVSEQEAHIETDKWVSRLMGDRSLGQQPQLFNSKMLGLVTKFQLEVRIQLDSQFYDTFQEAKASTKDIENGLARNAIRAAKITATMVELAVLQHVFGKAFEAVAGYNPAFDIVDAIIKAFGFDDEEDDEDTALDNIEEGFLSLLGDLPYTSTLTGGRMPIESALPVEQFFTGKDKYGNEKNRLETLAEAAPYYILPGGYSQIKKTVQGLGMFDDEHPVSGSYTKSGNLRFPVEDTPLNRAQAALFGQWASGNARDYFDNERSPLKKNQIEEFMSSGMKIQDYWDYREGLSDHDKLEDKADYINSLDVPIGTKNLLINNQTDRKTPIDMTDYDLYASLEEFDFANDNPERYDFFIENGITYDDYKSADEKGKRAYTWAYENPEKFKVAKLIENDVVQFRKYTSEIAALESDKDEDGDPISGSVKEKAARYIDNLNIDYGQKLIFFKFQYKKDDTYNYEILDYLYNKDDVSYEDKVAILKELGFTVSADGNVTW